MLLVGAGIAAMWAVAFTAFRGVFFRPGTWQFPVDSALIRLFPEPFWQQAAAALLGLTLIEGLALLGIGRRLARTPVEPAGGGRA